MNRTSRGVGGGGRGGAPQHDQQIDELGQKMHFVSQVLSNGELTLNCVQFLNLIHFYFDGKVDEPAESETTGTANTIFTCFPCIACSSQFSFEHTFHLHLERRSILVRFYCVKCDTFKTFYNKCKLIYHVYSHKMHLFEPIYKAIKIEAISMERLNMSKERSIERQSEAGLASLLAHSRVQLNDNEQIKLFLRRLLVNKFNLYKCGICDALFFDPRELKTHYAKSMNAELTMHRPHLNKRAGFKKLKQKYLAAFAPNVFDFLTENADCENNEKIELFVQQMNQYSFKKLQFSTRCAALAIINLIDNDSHTKRKTITHNQMCVRVSQPLAVICPECGLSFDPSTQLDQFRTHLNHECLLNRKYDYGQVRCPSCGEVSESANVFVSHWAKFHLVKQHLCDLCDKAGLRYVFEEEGNQLSTESGEIRQRATHAFKQILADEEGIEFAEPILSPGTIAEINRHFFEKHRNMQVTLKLIYRCMCGAESGAVTDSCVHTNWKSCHKHILNLISKALSTIDCLMCGEQLSTDEYPAHIRDMHQLEKIFICPICGVLGKDETCLHDHVLNVHNQVSLKDFPRSSFFNLISTLSHGAGINFDSSHPSSIIPVDFYVYQCLNCRLFFGFSCSFSHNCWTYVEMNKEPSEQKTPSSNNNYFSPIYLKFNVSKLLGSKVNSLHAANGLRSLNESIDL